MFGYRFSHWKLISRLVNTMEPDSKRHAVRSALPAVLLGPSLDLLFVLIEFICLPSASASLFFTWFGKAIVLGESPPYRSAKQTAGFFNLLGSVLLTGWNLSVPPSRMLRISVFCLSELMVGCLLSSSALAPPAWWVKRWLDSHFDAMRPCHSMSVSFSKAKTNILLRTACFLGHSHITWCLCDPIQSYAVLETAL